MTSKGIDRILLGLGALLILISSYQLIFAGSSENSGIKLGTLTSTLSIVKTKSALSLDWRDASTGNDLTENQLIYTDSESSAEVVFTGGSALEIGENSLVKLRSAGKEQSMDLSKGFIRAKLEGSKPLKVQMNGEDFVVSGDNADIQINIQDEKGEIGVLTGEVKIEGAGISENLNPQSALAIDGDKVVKKAIYFKTLTPLKSSVSYVLNSPTAVNFTWEPAKSAKVIISRRPTLENASTHEGSVIALNPGLYYYKVESEKGVSLVSSFRIIQETAPVIIRPRNGEEVTLLDDIDSKVLLQWKGEENFSYMIEWNDGEIHTATVTGLSTLIHVNPTVPFSWRIKIQESNRPDAIWSDWQNVKVKFIPKPILPTDLIPDGVEYQTYEKPNEKVELHWEKSENVELEIKDPSGNLHVEKVPHTFSTYTATQEGTYSWRIRSVDSHLRASEWTEWKTFSILDLSTEKPAEGIQRIQLQKPDQSVTFNWKAENGTSSVFELAKDQSFETIVKKIEVKSDSAKVNIPETGTYYWRSREYRSDGTFNVSEPKKVIIEPVPAPEKPEKLPDLEVPLEEMPAVTSMLESVFNFIISSAHADEQKGVVKIDLPVKEDAKGFIVRIYSDPELKNLVYEEELSNKHFEWKNAQAGTYYWQYAVIDYWNRKSLFSDASHLTVKADLVSVPEKPRLQHPIRAIEVEQKDLVLKWTESDANTKYKVEISESNDFKEIISSKEVKANNVSFADLNLKPKLHYWRVHAFNKKNKEVLSNTGRFTILPPLEKTIIADIPPQFVKVWKSRGFAAWAPSMDSYTFKDGETGKIDGTTMMSVLLSGTLFKENYAVNGELLRQTGEVFEGEKYLFQRLLLDGIYLIGKKSHHKWGAGLALGQTSGQAYEIDENAEVKSLSISGLSYGPLIRNYYSFNQNWEMQGRVQYLLGEITQMDFGADAIRHYKDWLILGGVSYSSRDYELSSGKQTSLKLSFGIGKEF